MVKKEMGVVEQQQPEHFPGEIVLRKALANAPTVQEVLAHPERYEAWLKKAQEALANG